MNAATSRTIAVIGGTGPAGMGLALRWARAGETIIIGSRDASPRPANGCRPSVSASERTPRFPAMENAAACAAADLLDVDRPFRRPGRAAQATSSLRFARAAF